MGPAGPSGPCGPVASVQAVAARLGVDLLGFNFWSGSRRYCPPQVARDIAARLPPHVLVVGVFVNQPREHVEHVASEVGLHLLQLHGDERPEDCTGYSLPVVKALQVSEALSPEALHGWPVHALLLDTPGAGFGGSGRTFAWERARGVSRQHTVWLAGGLTPENVGTAIRTVRPHVVDVATGVEVAPGIKDPDMLARFVAAARET
ncbi:MAG: phosphoribosylanthranilate isomerase [Myxococcaceae bacterium]|nr:phosphoribosylanthranilate isomerase [Myxococcaceae bacterium]MCI0673756.1 phosphoribosylanthranilate isomerase [Myxococcaceae bacterium]